MFQWTDRRRGLAHSLSSSPLRPKKGSMCTVVKTQGPWQAAQARPHSVPATAHCSVHPACTSPAARQGLSSRHAAGRRQQHHSLRAPTATGSSSISSMHDGSNPGGSGAQRSNDVNGPWGFLQQFWSTLLLIFACLRAVWILLVQPHLTILWENTSMLEVLGVVVTVIIFLVTKRTDIWRIMASTYRFPGHVAQVAAAENQLNKRLDGLEGQLKGVTQQQEEQKLEQQEMKQQQKEIKQQLQEVASKLDASITSSQALHAAMLQLHSDALKPPPQRGMFR